MPFASTPPAEQATGRDKRLVVAVAAAVLLVLAAVGVWAAVSPGSYGGSKNGCITVTVPSSTGGGLLHQCGESAKATCRRAFSDTGKLAALTRPQCRLAGIEPSR